MLLRAAGGVGRLAAGGHCEELAKSSSAAGLRLLHHQLAPLQEGTCSSYSPVDDVVVNVKQGRLPASGITTSQKIPLLCFPSQPSCAEGEADSRQPALQPALGRAVGKLCHFSPREL